MGEGVGIVIDEWEGCYEGGWKGWITPESFSHPAKFSRALIERIYDHARDEGWVKEGDTVLDPFAGVGLGGLSAMSMGLNWVGVELEEKFVDTAIGFDCDGIVESHEELKHFDFVPGGWYVRLRMEAAYWGKSLKKMYGGWDECEGFDNEKEAIEGKKKVLKQEGADRYNEDAYTIIYEEPEIEVDKVVTVIDKPARCGGRENHTSHHITGNFELWQRELAGWPNLGTARIVQGDSRKLKFCMAKIIGTPDLVVSSPPFSGDSQGVPVGTNQGKIKRAEQKSAGKGAALDGYGHTSGNLANLKEGKLDMICSSPAYAGARIGGIESMRRINDSNGDYGQSPGQLGAMKEGGFDAVVSSPPYEGALGNRQHEGDQEKYVKRQEAYRLKHPEFKRPKGESMAYPASKGNLGSEYGDTFWSASKIIVQQCYELLRDGGHAIWVTKDYVKKGQRVPFTDRWLALCESVGFRLVCHHHAMLVGLKFEKNHVRIVERKSFFRRLAESKGSPRIDWESVICFVK